MFLRTHPLMNQAGEDGGSGGGGGNAGGDGPKGGGKSGPEVFSREYVHELREENKATRLKTQEAENRLKALEEQLGKTTQETEAKLKDAEKAATQRVIKAEMKALAIKAGIVDLDGLALADLSKVKFDDKGNLLGADEAITALKESKPYLFGKPNTTSTATPPKEGNAPPKKALEMTDAEYSAEVRRLTGGR